MPKWSTSFTMDELRKIDTALNRETIDGGSIVDVITTMESQGRSIPLVLRGVWFALAGEIELEFALHSLRAYGWYHTRNEYVRASEALLDEKYPNSF